MNLSIPRPRSFPQRAATAPARPTPRTRATGIGYGDSSGYVRRRYPYGSLSPRFRMA